MATTPKEMAARAAKTKAETEQPAEDPVKDKPAEQPAPEPAKEPVKEPAPAAEEPKTDAKAADPAEVAEYCAANGAPSMAGQLIREKASMDQVKTKVGATGEIKRLTKLARDTGCKVDDGFEAKAIEGGMSVDEVRKTLFDKMTTQQSPEIRGNLSAGNMTTAGAKADKSWDKAVAKVNSRRK
jgi:ATP-dependent Clp protease, protease subunit